MLDAASSSSIHWQMVEFTASPLTHTSSLKPLQRRRNLQPVQLQLSILTKSHTPLMIISKQNPLVLPQTLIGSITIAPKMLMATIFPPNRKPHVKLQTALHDLSGKGNHHMITARLASVPAKPYLSVGQPAQKRSNPF